MQEVVDVDDELLADRLEAFSGGGRATRKPLGLRVRFGAAGGSSSFLHFDMSVLGKERTRVHHKGQKNDIAQAKE